MTKIVFLFVVLFLLPGCAGKAGNQSVQGEKTENTSIEKLQKLLPNYQKAMEESLPDVIAELKSVDSRFTTVTGYGNWLEKNSGMDADSLTIHSDAYWEAFVTMAVNNPAVYFSRLFLLIKEGRLSRADYVRLFTQFHMDYGKERDRTVIDYIKTNTETVTKAGDAFVEEGVTWFDKGEKDKAMRYYSQALVIYPKYPRANYEIGLTLMTENLGEAFSDSQPHVGYFAKVRSYDPFFAFAYQGKKAIAVNMPIILSEIEPALKRLIGKAPGPDDFRTFADGCVKIGEWELAAYAYNILLLMTVNKEKGFDLVTVKKFSDCLSALGASNAAAKIGAQYLEYNSGLAETKH